jgi:hypothetical protein
MALLKIRMKRPPDPPNHPLKGWRAETASKLTLQKIVMDLVGKMPVCSRARDWRGAPKSPVSGAKRWKCARFFLKKVKKIQFD